jgi:hypothetical protein
MFTTGSKFYFGLSATAYLAALAYGVSTGGHLWGVLSLGWKEGVGDHYGYSVLLGLAVASGLLGAVVVAFRDAEAHHVAEVAGTETVPEVAPPRSLNYWPIITAFAAGLLIVGLATGPVLFVIGAILAVICSIEWVISAWADRATGDAETNQLLRDRLLRPFELPLWSALVVGGVVFSLSRLFLAVSKIGAVVVGGVASTLILVVAFVLASRPHLSRSLVVGVAMLGGIGVLASGVVGASLGEREFHKHGEEHEGEHDGEEHEGEDGEHDDGESESDGEGDEG